MGLREDLRDGAKVGGGFFDDLKDLARTKLRELDEHPVGHIACELGRAKYQGRKLSLDELLGLVDDAMEADKPGDKR